MATFVGPAAVVLLSLARAAQGHGDHDEIPEGSVISMEPIDSVLWTHIILMGTAFGLIFPTGMVLGIIRSRWHVPVQVVGSVVAIVAFFLGHGHKGRQFASNIHASFAHSLNIMLAMQVGLGVYLKLHLEKVGQRRLRPYLVTFHGILGKAMPLVSWVQMLFGGITALGFCREDHLGQCLAHFIMGSAFIAYGILLTIVLLVGQLWLRRTGRSQEFFDSLIITVWGCINTFTEHRWGQEWGHNDLQHTTMGIVWWCAGMLGMWLSRTRSGRPNRNLVPAMVILLTGYAMSAHPQNLKVGTAVHTVFGYTLMAAGAARLIEIAFVLKDQNNVGGQDSSEPSSFQYLTPFLLCASGFLFLGATEEQMQLLADSGITHVSYVLILYSCAFLMFLFVNILLNIYSVHAWPAGQDNQIHLGTSRGLHENANGDINGHHPRSGQQEQQIHDALDYELESLIGAGDKDHDDDNSSASDGRARHKLADEEGQAGRRVD